jgi:glycosyltransferase involved in cell wall biosynthesis
MFMNPDNDSRLKILQVSPVDIGGGAELSALNLHQAYLNRGCKSWMAVGQRRSDIQNIFQIPNEQRYPWWSRTIRAFIKRNESFQEGPVLQQRALTALRVLGDPAWYVKREIGLEDFHYPGTSELVNLAPNPPDIVHCHNLHGSYFDLRFLPRLSRQKPLVINLHDTWLLSGHCAYSFDCERWQRGCGGCPYLDTYPALRRDATAINWKVKQRILNNSRLYLTVGSRWLMDQVQRSMLKGIECRLIYYGIDLNIFKPHPKDVARQTLGLPGEAKIVVFTAHSDFKGLDYLKQALGSVQKGGDSPLLFLCLGKDGKDERLGDGLLHYCGLERKPERMALYYSAADVYAHAARAETFGMTVSESLACNTPVVAMAVGGVPEQIHEEETGFLIQPFDTQKMAERIALLLEDEGMRIRMGRAGSDDIGQRYNHELRVNAFLDWYREVILDWTGWLKSFSNDD